MVTKVPTKFKQTELGPIPEEWDAFRLENLVEKVIDNRGKTPPITSSGYEILEVNAIQNGRRTPNYEKVTKFVNQETYNIWFRTGHIKEGDIIIPTVGTIGNVAISLCDRGSIAQNLIALRLNQKTVPAFTYYLLFSPQYKEKLFNLDIGGVQPSIKVPHLLNTEVYLPSLKEQKQIAEILSSLDDKIELNRRMNKTLESIGQAIFKRWFVDFEFPNEQGKPYKSCDGEMVESELGEIPKDWEVMPLSKLVVDSQNGDWGKEEEQGIFIKPVFCIRGTDIFNLAEGNMGKLPLRYIKSESYKNKSLCEGDIVIEISGGSPTQSTGRCVLITGELLSRFKHPLICSNFCKVLRFKTLEIASVVYSLFSALYQSGEFFQYENGTSGIKNLDVTSFIEIYKLALPEDKILSTFALVFKENYFSVQKNGKQNYSISQIRDSLLPRLMSGKIRTNTI